jgi:hypothetical protein
MGTAIGLAVGVALEQLMSTMLLNAGEVHLSAYLVVVPSRLMTVFTAMVPCAEVDSLS